MYKTYYIAHMKNWMFKVLLTLLVALYISNGMAALKISNTSLIANSDNQLKFTFTATTNEPAQLYLSYTNAKGIMHYTAVSKLAKQHTIELIGISTNTQVEVKAHAFNHKGSTHQLLNPVFVPGENIEALNQIRKTTMKKSALDENILLTSDRGNGKDDFAFIMDKDGNIIWYETLPNSNENADCNAINYDKGYIIISDCHTITRMQPDGTDTMTYTLEGDSLYSGSFFHDKAIINQDGNIVSLFAHKTIIDKSLINGDSIIPLVSDGFVEFDFETGEVLYTYSPATEIPERSTADYSNSLCNYYKPLNVGGRWASVFGDSIEYYRLATEINQDFDAGYFLTMSKDTLSPAGGIAKINPFSSSCEIEASYISPSNKNFVFYEDDYFVNPRSFSVLPNGDYFMLTNYPDTTDITIMGTDTLLSPFADGTTIRALKYYLEFGYMGYFVMFWTVDEYRFPEAAYTELGSALWMPNDNILGFSDTNNTLYEINDQNEVTGEWRFSEPLKVCAIVEDLYPVETDISIVKIDSIFCKDDMQMFQLTGIPNGGYFEGVPLSEDNIFYPDSVDAGIYTITYHFGPDSASIHIQVEECVGIETLEAMGGLDSYLFPNPVGSQTPMLKYRQAKAGELLFETYDLNGKLIEQINLGYRTMGLSAEHINLKQYANGVYVYRITSGDMQQYKRFVVTR